MPGPTDVATHWRCHQCNNMHVWALTPACTSCEHGCAICATLVVHVSPRRRARIIDGLSPSTVTVLTAQEPLAYKAFWRCHRCPTYCAKGDIAEHKEWRCTTCRHAICWDCSNTIKDALTGIRIPALRSVSGPALPDVESSLEACNPLEKSADSRSEQQNRVTKSLKSSRAMTNTGPISASTQAAHYVKENESSPVMGHSAPV